MQDGGTGADAQHGGTSREANLIFVLPPNGPPGGLFDFKFSSRPHPRKFGQKRFLVVRRSWQGNGVACFWATSLEEIIGGVIAISSFRPGGWMQQSAVPRCAILGRETGASGSETPRFHHVTRRRGGGMAARGTRAAEGADAAHWHAHGRPRTTRKRRPESRRSCTTAATCGSTSAGPRAMPTALADTRRNWLRSRRTSSWPRATSPWGRCYKPPAACRSCSGVLSTPSALASSRA